MEKGKEKIILALIFIIAICGIYLLFSLRDNTLASLVNIGPKAKEGINLNLILSFSALVIIVICVILIVLLFSKK